MSWSPDKFSLCPLFQLDPYPKVRTEKEKEIYVYLYRSDKVLLLKNVGLYPDPKNNFIREPFIAMFKAGNFDFNAINIRTIYGKNINERRHEAEKLAEVYKSVQNRDKENDVLLMGDFNLPPDDNGFFQLKKIPTMTFLDGSIPTTIKDQLYDNIWFQFG